MGEGKGGGEHLSSYPPHLNPAKGEEVFFNVIPIINVQMTETQID
jgi:hypothetical protein